MIPLYQFEIKDRRRRRVFVAGAWLLAIAAASAIDHFVWAHATVGKSVESRDWWEFLRVFGYLPTWVVVWLAVDGARRRVLRPDPQPTASGRPGLATLLAAAGAGALAEILKLIVARERPGDTGEYVWRGLFSGFSHGGNLGFPSSHAAVAFGAAFTLAAAFSGLRGIAILCATGCAVSRILPGAHFFSDVVAGAALGALTSALVRPLATGRELPA